MVTGIILASGFSKRMGKNKLLIEVDGVKILERVILAAKASMIDEIILVYRVDEIKELGQKYNLKTIFNENAQIGQSASVLLGVEHSKGDAYMFFVGDQPYLNSTLIDKLIFEYRNNPTKIIIPCHNDNIGMPIIFPAIFRDSLLKVKGDKGGSEIIRNNPSLTKKIEVHDGRLLADIDTIEDFKRLV